MIDYLNDNLWQAWALLSVACILLELFSGGFFILCFAIGGLAALVASFFCGFYAQLTVFAVVSAVSIFLVRPFAIRYIHLNSDPVPSNADAIMGREAIVSQDIPAGGYGRVAIDGDDWKATAAIDLKKGTKVRIIGRESIILTCEMI